MYVCRGGPDIILCWISLITELPLALPESVKETFKVVLTVESVDKILWCDHSNETSSAVLSHGTICLVGFEKNEIKDFS